jgi:hypothetical protein
MYDVVFNMAQASEVMMFVYIVIETKLLHRHDKHTWWTAIPSESGYYDDFDNCVHLRTPPVIDILARRSLIKKMVMWTVDMSPTTDVYLYCAYGWPVRFRMQPGRPVSFQGLAAVRKYVATLSSRLPRSHRPVYPSPPPPSPPPPPHPPPPPPPPPPIA